eukprot:COSAG02_NODE_6885_length_3309_cov_1.979439_1_plen_280_part_10
MPKKGQKLLTGLKRTGSKVVARAPGSAKQGIYVDQEQFEKIIRLANEPLQADVPADQDALLAAYEVVAGIVQSAEVDAFENPAQDDADTLTIATEKVLERTKSASPKQKAALIAQMANTLDSTSKWVTGEAGERIESLKQKLAEEYSKTPNDPSSGLTPKKATIELASRVEAAGERVQTRRTLQLPSGPAVDASVRNPETSTARPVRQSPPVAPRPGTRPGSSAPATPTFDAESSPELTGDSPLPRRPSPQPTPRPGAQAEDSDDDLDASFKSTERGDLD